MAAPFAARTADRRFVIDQNHEINVTPFIDVMLVLLIVSIIAAVLGFIFGAFGVLVSLFSIIVGAVAKMRDSDNVAILPRHIA